MKIYKDGNKSCATLDSFVDLEKSIAGFGDTEAEALSDLVNKLGNRITALENSLEDICHQSNFGNRGSCGDCESSYELGKSMLKDLRLS